MAKTTSNWWPSKSNKEHIHWLLPHGGGSGPWTYQGSQADLGSYPKYDSSSLEIQGHKNFNHCMFVQQEGCQVRRKPSFTKDQTSNPVLRFRFPCFSSLPKKRSAVVVRVSLPLTRINSAAGFSQHSFAKHNIRKKGIGFYCLSSYVSLY